MQIKSDGSTVDTSDIPEWTEEDFRRAAFQCPPEKLEEWKNRIRKWEDGEQNEKHDSL